MNPEAVSDGPSLFDLPILCRYFSDRSPQAMLAVAGPTHIIRYVNPTFARLAGRPLEALIGRPFQEGICEEAGNGCEALLDRVYLTGTPENLAEQLQQKTPPIYWSYTVWAILGPDERPAGVMIHVTDSTSTATFRAQSIAINEALVVSSVRQHELIDTIRRGEQERRELEAQLFQAQKLESLGVLAGGIAHDLNNMLTPVIGYTELATDALPTDSPAIAMLNEVGINARRAADLVHQILAYAGKGRFVLRLVDLSVLVREMKSLLGSVVSTQVQLRYDLADSLPLIEADETQLRQVVMNLVMNASEAMTEGAGTITVRTGKGPIDRLASTTTAVRPSVFLEVSDTGCGMPADVKEKIFDPFFTTKFTGRGLGLAVVHGIARGHQGRLEVSSEPGKGSTFRIQFPCSTHSTVSSVLLPPKTSRFGSGTILLVDDDVAVRGLASRILEKAGLTVLVGGDGKEGVSLFREHSQDIDAVVMDLTMPRMGGLEAAKVMRELRRDLAVVLMSGYSVEDLTQHADGFGITGFIQKPFNSSSLLEAIHSAIGKSR